CTLPARPLACDQEAGRDRLVLRRLVRERPQPLLGDDGVLVLAEHVLEDLCAGDHRLLAGELGGVARALPALAERVERLVGRIVARGVDVTAELLQRDVALRALERLERRLEAVEQVRVALPVERLQERAARTPSRALEPAQ